MRPTRPLGCVLALALLSGCMVLDRPLTSPPGVSNPVPAPATGAKPAVETSPFSRLSNPTDGQTLQVGDYLVDATGSLRVLDVAITGGADADQDGAPNYQVQAQVDLGSQGRHDVEIAENDVPAATGGLDTFSVTDRTASSSFVFQLTPDNGNGVLQTGDTFLTFLFTDDQQVLIDNESTPVTLDAAAERIARFVQEGGITPHAVALLYARLVRSTVDTTPQAYSTTSFEQWVMGNRLFLQSLWLIIFRLLFGLSA